jgi:hypothetical protein
MQFILYQAKDVGTINEYQSQYLWKQISRHGWRTREPPETDFTYEQPVVFPHIVNLHVNDLGYDLSDFESLFHMEANELRKLYGLQDKAIGQRFLRLVK